MLNALALVFPVYPRPRAHTPVARAGDLEIVLQPGINLALWCREPVSAVGDEVAELPACAFPDLRCVTSARTCRVDLEGLILRSPPIADTGHTRILFCLDA